MLNLPAGTVTFLFTDVVSSALLVEQHPQRGIAALEAQLALQAEDWHDLGDIQVKMALHTGEAEPIDRHYYNAALYRLGALVALAHGGQILLTGATSELVIDALPAGATLLAVGDYALNAVSRPQRISQLVHPAIRSVFPPLQALQIPANLRLLTAREREIVDLLARGYSNRYIAQRLVLASSTVERHVANVLNKLDLHSRTQIAAWVAANGAQVRQNARTASRG